MIRNYIILALLIIVAILSFFMRGCDTSRLEKLTGQLLDQKIEAIHDTVEVLKDTIIYQEKEVIKWKKIKGEIEYVTHFDTFATIDTVLVELVKCDSIVRIDSVIIARQDTANKALHQVVAKREEEIEIKDEQIDQANKSAGKRERRGFLFGFGLGYLAGLLTPR